MSQVNPRKFNEAEMKIVHRRVRRDGDIERNAGAYALLALPTMEVSYKMQGSFTICVLSVWTQDSRGRFISWWQGASKRSLGKRAHFVQRGPVKDGQVMLEYVAAVPPDPDKPEIGQALAFQRALDDLFENPSPTP